MDLPPTDRLVSEEEYLALPETNQRMELIDGEIIVSPSATFLHQVCVRRLLVGLEAWVELHAPAELGLSPLDVRLGPARIVQPDLCVFLGGLPDVGMPLTTIPDLAIEVLSQRRSHDRIAKRLLYAEAGVKEYWLVDAQQACVEIVRGLETVRVERETLTSSLLPGFALGVPGLFTARAAQ